MPIKHFKLTQRKLQVLDEKRNDAAGQGNTVHDGCLVSCVGERQGHVPLEGGLIQHRNNPSIRKDGGRRRPRLIEAHHHVAVRSEMLDPEQRGWLGAARLAGRLRTGVRGGSGPGHLTAHWRQLD
ncbi:hypothetical protein GCM10022631_09540 [Deinococcus rubellus]